MAAQTPTAESIFCVALDIESAQKREQYVKKSCAGDSKMQNHVMRLLAAHFASGEFMDWVEDTHVETRNEKSVCDAITVEVTGPYRLLEVIGEGGMGTVYMAEQTEPVKRRVALKLIKTGMDTRQVVARFETERQALALMDHPNIAKVLDAGATESGRPYFVMELVKGKPITKFCDEQRLDTEARLKLFQKVCQAVQHAHQKGIIHRDLKPSNVMVAMYDDQPVPKVIDFGVAKATGDSLTEQTIFTRFGQIVGTLAYMSPEQAQFNNLDIDTRSDIYSLGAILYELLAGEPPFEREKIKSQALDETLRMIREDEPTKPSTRLSAVQKAQQTASDRRTSPEKLGSRLRGDLDWIVMKALEKDRSRRYETAQGLASDVGSYLASEPVSAGPQSTTYRLAKFAHRNKGLLAACGAIVVSLLLACAAIGFATFNGWHQQQKTLKALAASEVDRERLDGLSEFIITGLISKANPNGVDNPDISIRDAMIELKEEIDDFLPDSPDVRAWVRAQLGHYLLDIREFEESVAVLTAAYSEQGDLKGKNDPATLWTGKRLAFCLSHLGRHEEAINLAREIATSAEENHGDVPAVAACWNSLGVALFRAGRLDDSERALRHGIDMHDRIGSISGPAIGNLGDVYRERRDFKKAEELYQEALRLRSNHDGMGHIETMRVMNNLANCYIEQKKSADAKRLLEDLLKQNRISGVGEQHRSNLDTLNSLARLDYELGNYEGALQSMEQAIRIASQMFGEVSQQVLNYKNNRILIIRDLRRWSEARTRCEELIDDLETLRKAQPSNLDTLTSIGIANWQLGMVLGFDQKHTEAIEPVTIAVNLFEEQLESENPGLGVRQYLCDTLRWRSTSLRHVRRFEESIADAERARTLADSLDEQLDCDLHRAQVMAETGQHDEAVNIAENVMDELDTEAYLAENAASVYAICLKTNPLNEETKERYFKRALELLQLAADLGQYERPFSDLALSENSDFDSLAGHKMFVEFVEQITSRGKKTN